MTTAERHGVITNYLGVVLSVIAIILSVISMHHSHVMETREIVQILQAKDDGYYYFDGENLFRNFQVTIANNSAIPVSVIEITIERGWSMGRVGRDWDMRTFSFSNMPDILPLNLEANHTEVITIPWLIQLSQKNMEKIRAAKESSINVDSILLEVTDSEVKLTSNCSYTFQFAASDWLSTYSIQASAPKLDKALSVTLHTGKDKSYVLETEDTASVSLLCRKTVDSSRSVRLQVSKSVDEGELVAALMCSGLLQSSEPAREFLESTVPQISTNQEE